MRLKVSLISLILLSTLGTFESLPVASAAGGTYAFTTAGSSGINGPIQESVTAAYLGTSLAGQVIIRTRGIQEWTVPATDTYSVTAAGASGGYAPGKLGGRGRTITSQIFLAQGQVLKILVGQEGGRSAFTTSSGGYAGGGGGGTFIVDSATSGALLVVGGGGGGAQSRTGLTNANGSDGLDAAAYNSTSGIAGTGGGAGGTSGGGGVTTGNWCAGGGGGFTGDGSTFSSYGFGGKSFLNGGVSGANYAVGTSVNVPGGFGGGGGALAMDNYETNGGGGGGYSGGGCGRNAQNLGGGGGGGNFYTGLFVSNSLNTGNGYATFTRMNLPAAQISLSANASSVTRNATTITATANAPGVVTFLTNGKRIPNCISLKTQISGQNYVAVCNWKPSIRGSATITAQITPSDLYGPGSSQSANIAVTGRGGTR